MRMRMRMQPHGGPREESILGSESNSPGRGADRYIIQCMYPLFHFPGTTNPSPHALQSTELRTKPIFSPHTSQTGLVQGIPLPASRASRHLLRPHTSSHFTHPNFPGERRHFLRMRSGSFP